VFHENSESYDTKLHLEITDFITEMKERNEMIKHDAILEEKEFDEKVAKIQEPLPKHSMVSRNKVCQRLKIFYKSPVIGNFHVNQSRIDKLTTTHIHSCIENGLMESEMHLKQINHRIISKQNLNFQ
jgi:hypothetical protein